MNRFRKYAPWFGPIGRKKKSPLFKFLYFTGPLLFFVILHSIDYKRVYHIFVNAHLFPIIAGLLLVPIEVLIRAFQLRRVVSLQAELPFFDAVKAHFIGVSFGTVTPGGLGSFAKLEMIKKATLLDTVSSLALVTVDKLFSLFTLFSIGTIGLLIASKHLTGIRFFAWIIPVLFLTIFFCQRYVHPFLALIGRIAPKKYRAFVMEHLQNIGLIFSLFAEKRGKSLIIVCLSLIAWLLLFTRIFLYAGALGIHVSFFYFLLIFPITTLIESMPFSIMGVGTRDLTLIFLFSRLGIGKEHAVSLSMMCLILLLVFETSVGFFITYREYISAKRVMLLKGDKN